MKKWEELMKISIMNILRVKKDVNGNEMRNAYETKEFNEGI